MALCFEVPPPLCLAACSCSVLAYCVGRFLVSVLVCVGFLGALVGVVWVDIVFLHDGPLVGVSPLCVCRCTSVGGSRVTVELLIVGLRYFVYADVDLLLVQHPAEEHHNARLYSLCPELVPMALVEVLQHVLQPGFVVARCLGDGVSFWFVIVPVESCLHCLSLHPEVVLVPPVDVL